MRIVDQYGCADVPYEQTVFVIDEGSVVARIPDGGKILMAQYSDIKVAKKAMTSLRIAYSRLLDNDSISRQYFGKSSEYFYFPAEEDL